MGQKAKVLVTDDGRFDLDTHEWDDQRFSQFLTQNKAIRPEMAMDLSRFIRQEITKMESCTVTIPVIEKMIEKKLEAYGVGTATHIQLDKSAFFQAKPALSQNAVKVLERRYLKKDRSGKVIEPPENMFRRVAHHIAKAEKNYSNGRPVAEMENVFYEMMTTFKFLPNSPTLMNAGRKLGQLAACFVLPVEDSMEAIFDSIKHSALIHKSGGGTGFSFSRLRPANSRVGTTGGVASGPVSFMKVFNTATEQVKQGGTRRGANMAVLRVDHPDILEFIHCKEDARALNNFNISVAVTDTFMAAVSRKSEYNLISPKTGKKAGTLNAAEVYSELVKQAWKTGDPGIIFIDRVNRNNPLPDMGDIESTNPCGEQPLLPMESCNLGSINLARFVVQGTGTKAPRIDFEGLRETIGHAMRFLDNTIDMSKYPLPEIEAMVKGNRKVGLGVMGFADLLFQMQVPYNSTAALKLAEKIMKFLQTEAHEASRRLGEERGVFGNFKRSVFKNRKNAKFRNATTTTIAPTGTLSIIAGCSSGIEPIYALSFIRNVMDGDQLVEINPWFERRAKEDGFYSEELSKTIAAKGSIQGNQDIPQEVRDIFVTAHDISPEWHVRMQAAFQKYTDNAVSKTVNLHRDSSEADVLRVYNLAYELGCKGLTIYRDGSKDNQVLSHIARTTVDDGFMAVVKDRPETLDGFTTKIRTGMGHLYVTITEFEGRPFEVFATIGKSGKSTTAKTEAIGRLISLALRAGVTVEDIVEQIKGIRGEHAVFHKGELVFSIPDAIGKIMEERYLKSRKQRNAVDRENTLTHNTCPDCKESLIYEEGCLICHGCGYSRCG